MLSQTKMVAKAREAIESLYDATCTITERQKVKKENKSTGFQEMVVLENQPCRLSYQTIGSANVTESGASAISQAVKLFIAPEVEVKPGSKLTITQNGVVSKYQNSGEPAHYTTHQVVILELFKGWA